MSIVIGGGHTGLLTAFATKSLLISERVEGRMNGPFTLGPKILHASPETNKLVKDLGIDEEPNVFRVGYLYDGKVYNNPPGDFRSLYYEHTRGTKNYSGSSMSNGNNEIVGWDLNKINLMDRIRHQVDIIEGSVIDIDKDMNYLSFYLEPMDKTLSLTFDTLYCCICIGRVHKLMGLSEPDNLLTSGTHFLKVPISELGDLGKYSQHYSYLYVVDHYSFHRVTFLPDSSEAVLEFTQDSYRSGTYMDFFPHRYIPSCQLLTKIGMKSIPGTNVQLVGRYAEWDHSIRLHDILRRFNYGST